ncbi:MAG: GPR endopeptidase, partial [Pygmaiobacter sp.]
QFASRYVGVVVITRVEILKYGLARRKGHYSTIDMPNFAYIDDRNHHYIDAIAHELANFLPETGDILVVGLGNAAITADALGPAVCDKVLVTRHIPVEEDERAFLKLRGVFALCPGIEAKTGLSAAETVRAVVESTKPAVVLCVDSLYTGDASRLGCTVQLTDTGLCPGGDETKRLDAKVLGVPVISMGVPTVMDAAEVCRSAHRLVVTPKEIDYIISRAANVLGLAINRAFQKELSVAELTFLTS